MARLNRDEELERIVRELNESDRAAGIPASWPPATLPEGEALERVLADMAQRGASDLLILAGSPPVLRVGGRLVIAEATPLDATDIDALLGALLTRSVRERMESDGAADLSLRVGTASNAHRFRVNLHRQRGTLAAAVRALPQEIPTIADLDLPPILAELVKPARGLVLICGATGSGKTTTLAAMVGEINRTASRHIITIEDPVEYEHRNAKSVIEQVEIGRDAPSFAAALRASLRQDPDVILVGEMRDLETVATALTAAETGHLILSTLHTNDAAQAVHRIVDVFPPAQQTQIRHQLAMSLNAIVCQQLIPRADVAGRAVAVEVLLTNDAVRNHIRTAKLQQLPSEITLGKRQGMISFEESLASLVRRGWISSEEAKVRSSRTDELESLMGR